MLGAPTSASSAVAAPRELLSGIDSLDLTCKIPACGDPLAELDARKGEAQIDPRRPVLLQIGDEWLRVAPSGMGPWLPFRLEHRFGNLGVGESRNRPSWKVSVSAEALHLEGAERAVGFWRSIIETLTGSPASLHGVQAGRARRLRRAEHHRGRPFRIRVPVGSRAVTDPRWSAVQAAQVAAGAQAAERIRGERHAPALDRIVPMLNGLLVSAGAALGITDADDVLRQVAMLAGAYRQDNDRDFATEVRTRRLEFRPSVA